MAATTILLELMRADSNAMQGRPLCRYKGHQNTSKNFIRVSFGPGENVVLSGSEDGYVYIWDTESGDLVQRLEGNAGVVYSAVWNSRTSEISWYVWSPPPFLEQPQSLIFCPCSSCERRVVCSWQNSRKVQQYINS